MSYYDNEDQKIQTYVRQIIEIAHGTLHQKKYNQYSLHDKRTMAVMDAILQIFESNRSGHTQDEFTAFKADAFQMLAKLSVPIPVDPRDAADTDMADESYTPKSPQYTPISPSYYHTVATPTVPAQEYKPPVAPPPVIPDVNIFAEKGKKGDYPYEDFKGYKESIEKLNGSLKLSFKNIITTHKREKLQTYVQQITEKANFLYKHRSYDQYSPHDKRSMAVMDAILSLLESYENNHSPRMQRTRPWRTTDPKVHSTRPPVHPTISTVQHTNSLMIKNCWVENFMHAQFKKLPYSCRQTLQKILMPILLFLTMDSKV
jgi:citrate synthase